MAGEQRLVGAIDLGGTKIYSAVLAPDGKLLGEDLRPSEAASGRHVVFERMVASLTAAAKSAGAGVADMSGVGVAAPGLTNWHTGHVVAAPNLLGWNDVPLGPILSEQLGLPVVVDNDANLAALGEYSDGAGRGAKVLIYLTISTGIGSGFVFGGQIFRGVGGTAGEAGHMIVQVNGPPCSCGSQGCLEALASGTAIARMGNELIAEGRAPTLQRMAAEAGEPVSSTLVARAAAEGDPGAREILNRAGTALGAGLANLVNLLNPDVIVIGGGAAHIGPPLLEPAERLMRELAFSDPAERVRILSATLEYAAIQGINALVRKTLTSV